MIPSAERITPSSSQKSPRQVTSAQLFDGDERTVIIVHDGTRYVLRITRLGKLILTK